MQTESISSPTHCHIFFPIAPLDEGFISNTIIIPCINYIITICIKKYQIEITKRFAAFENLNADESVNSPWENIKQNIKTSAKESLGLHELKHHKPWFDKERVGLLDQRKQAKMQWIQDPSRYNVDNLNNVRRDATDISGTKRRHI